jgi:hypothetical protein
VVGGESLRGQQRKGEWKRGSEGATDISNFLGIFNTYTRVRKTVAQTLEEPKRSNGFGYAGWLSDINHQTVGSHVYQQAAKCSATCLWLYGCALVNVG